MRLSEKPEYFFQPMRLLKRLIQFRKPKSHFSRRVTLPWKSSIIVNVSETIGFAIWRFGIYDLGVSEVLWRLISTGDTVADVGANLGYMSNLMLTKAGKTGKIIAFEPHPEIFSELIHNMNTFSSPGSLHCRLFQMAVSDQVGVSHLVVPKDMHDNRGIAYVKGTQTSKEYLSEIPIELTTLDAVANFNDGIQVTKIDTEGSELKVLQGAQKLLTSRKMRDIVFESHEDYPNATTNFLENHGYSLFFIRKGFFGVKLIQPADFSTAKRSSWEATNCLATLESERAINLLKSFGWRVLSNRY